MATAKKALLGIAVLAATTGVVHGHGYLTTPASRNVADYCGHCLNSGGPGSVNAGGQYKHGMCGNTPTESPQSWNAASSSPVTIGESGDSVLLEVVITAHHLGWFEFELCDSPDISEACFREHKLLRSGCDVATKGEEECRRWWKPLKPDEYNHYSLTPQGYPDGAPFTTGCNYVIYATYYDLPDDVSCTHCVLRWYWHTTNSCTGPTSTGEEFWNCADVRINAPAGATTVDTRPGSYAALNAVLTATMPTDLSAQLPDRGCPTPAYGTAGEYYCGKNGDVTGTDGCYAATAGETCTIGFYENSIAPVEEGTPLVSYCTWTGVCLADGEGGRCVPTNTSGVGCPMWTHIHTHMPHTCHTC
jgi:hypothetical protein